MSRPAAFRDLVESAFDLRWTIDPVAATGAGLAAYDGRLGLYADEDVARYVAALKAEAAALEELQVDDLADEVDRTALLGDTRVAIHRFEREKAHVKNPTFWLSHILEGLYLLLAVRDRPAAHRARALRERLDEIPRVLTLARATLQDCPRVFVDSAMQIATGGAGLLDEVGSAWNGDDPSAATALRDAREAVRHFHRYLEGDLAPVANGEFAIGEDAFNFRLHHEHALRQKAPELWRYGHTLIEETEGEMARLAAEIDPRAPWPDVLDRLRADHPSRAELVDAYAREMGRARRFVEERELVAIPDGALEVVVTPPFLRPLTPFAAYHPPGAFSSDRTGRFYVTPPDEGGDASRTERVLRDHCFHDLASTALHEGYPGHHLQFLYAHRQPRLVRKVIGSALSIEGWALYCEDMMAEEGFFETREQRLFQKLALLWRAVRIVADVGLHTRGMTYDQAVDLLVSRLHVDRSHAEAEARRYCAEPCYQLSYAVGRREIKSLRDAYRRAAGADFTLRGFHEAVLAYGGLPVSLMRWGMGLPDV